MSASDVPGEGDPSAMSASGSRHVLVGGDIQDGARTGARQKLGAVLAKRIVREIMAEDWPVGQVIGSEADLLDRYGASRSILREAVRLLEHQGVAGMRRGPGGGLVVAEPDPDAVTEAMALVLEYQRCDAPSMLEARLALELTATDLAAQRIDEDGIALLRECLAEEERALATEQRRVQGDVFHHRIAQLTANPALHLFIVTVTKLTMEHSAADSPAAPHETHADHLRIADAVISGDAALARHRMLRHLEATRSYLK